MTGFFAPDDADGRTGGRRRGVGLDEQTVPLARLDGFEPHGVSIAGGESAHKDNFQTRCSVEVDAFFQRGFSELPGYASGSGGGNLGDFDLENEMHRLIGLISYDGDGPLIKSAAVADGKNCSDFP